MKFVLTTAMTLMMGMMGVTSAQAFSIGFDWAGLKLCTSGQARTVGSPAFTLKDIPAGTTHIRFKMVDLNNRGYNHGGGTVVWSGEATIPAGAFKYKSPCPPSGANTYEWTATALAGKGGAKLGQAKAKRQYPE